MGRYNRRVKRRPERSDRASAETKPRAPDADADADHFARAMADVVPLVQDPRGRVRSAPHVTAPRAATRHASPSTRHDIQDADAVSNVSFVAPGVDRRELRKLKRGDYVPGKTSSRLDLHGQTAAEAVASVKRFINSQTSLARRASSVRASVVCIVHGRGLHSEGNVAILRTRVRECLRQHPAVLAYADAPPGDGGAGAVHVLLRK